MTRYALRAGCTLLAILAIGGTLNAQTTYTVSKVVDTNDVTSE